MIDTFETHVMWVNKALALSGIDEVKSSVGFNECGLPELVPSEFGGTAK